MSYVLAVLVSGRGSNLQALIDESLRSNAFQIGVVISNKEDAYALQRAENHNIPTVYIPQEAAWEDEITKVINEYNCDLICLAGFMKILSSQFIKTTQQKIINIHPSLLPAFPGLNSQKQALEYGVKYSGCTVHFVDEGVDSGPIIMQAVVPVLDDDTVESLAERILQEEHRIYPEVVKLMAQGRVEIQGRKVFIK